MSLKDRVPSKQVRGNQSPERTVRCPGQHSKWTGKQGLPPRPPTTVLPERLTICSAPRAWGRQPVCWAMGMFGLPSLARVTYPSHQDFRLTCTLLFPLGGWGPRRGHVEVPRPWVWVAGFAHLAKQKTHTDTHTQATAKANTRYLSVPSES